jgi:hypothetical protein
MQASPGSSFPRPTQRRFALRVLRLPPHKLPAARWSVDLDFWRPFEETTDTISCVGRGDAGLPDVDRGRARNRRPVPHRGREPHERWTTRGGTASTRLAVERHGRRPTRYRAERALRTQPLHRGPLLPSDTDNGVTAILESFAMGTPVICTETQGQVDVVEDGVNGVLVPAGSPEALRSAILRLWNDPAECARLGKERPPVRRGEALRRPVGVGAARAAGRAGPGR